MCDVHEDKCVSNEHEINFVTESYSIMTEEKKEQCKPCCACPDTRSAMGECILLNGEEECADLIEAHKACMRAAGFQQLQLPFLPGMSTSPRKSKRVAKKQQQDVFWLMHNFPQGLNPDDFNADKDIISNVNEKLRDSEQDTVRAASRQMPHILRSGRAIAAPAVSTSSGSVREDSVSSSGEESDETTPEEREQKERVEKAKLPKFQSEPETICTRSGARYSFDWKKSPDEKKKGKKLRMVPTPNKIVTRNSMKTRNNVSLTPVPPKPVSSKPGPKRASAPAPLDSRPMVIKPTRPVSVKPAKPGRPPAAKIVRPPSTKPARPPSTPPTKRAGKRMRLSLLPVRKKEEDDEISAPILGTLNIQQPVSNSRPSSPSLTPKRRGRTASLNCKAVLSALIKPELTANKRCSKKALTSITGNSETSKAPDNFFKIRISTSFSQRVEFVHQGCATKLNNSPQSLREHESMILACSERVKTNGWKWIGSHIDCVSFVTATSVRTTRLFFSAMERGGVELRVGDSVALKTGGATGERPFVGKIVAMWQDNLGEMMVTMCWFYRPGDLENIRTPYGAHELARCMC
eukprot:sb/3463391/